MRHVRTILVAAIAAAALAAVPASASASIGFAAAGTTSPPYKIAGSIGESVITVPTVGPKACNTTTMSATMGYTGDLTSSSVANAKCVGGGEMKFNGCQLTFRPNSSTVDLGSAGCGLITVGSFSICETASIQPKSGATATYGGYVANPETEVRVHIEAKNLSVSFGNPHCESSKVAEFNVELTLKIEQSGTLYFHAFYPGTSVNLRQSGSTFTSDAEVEGELFSMYPSKASGSNASGTQFQVPDEVTAAVAECKTAKFSAAALSEPATLSLPPTYEGCSSGELGSATVAANSCKVVLGSSSSTSISCSKEGDAIEWKMPELGITVRFTPDSGSAVSYENIAKTGWFHFDSKVRPHGVVTGLNYTCAPVFLCGLGGIAASGANGEMHVDTTLSAVFGT